MLLGQLSNKIAQEESRDFPFSTKSASNLRLYSGTCWQVFFDFFQEEATEQLLAVSQVCLLLLQGFPCAHGFIVNQLLPLVGWLCHTRLQQCLQRGPCFVCFRGDISDVALENHQLMVLGHTQLPPHPLTTSVAVVMLHLVSMLVVSSLIL